MDTTAEKRSIRGGEFLIRESQAQDIFIREEFTEEQKMMAEATQDFIEKEINPNIEKIEKQEDGIMPSLMEKAGELGLLGISIPEEYGGLGMSFNTSMLIADEIGATGSFSTAYGAHTGIGTLPILYYGNEEQKKKYLPLLASGEWKSCYCLTEPDAGSDANSGKTKAALSADGKHYVINGQKMWISNGGFADLLIVFAKIDDDKKLTAFLVEKTYGGITMNDEEVKLGIKGSSTRQIFFNDCQVPVENMLSERENGFKIAVNILNIGRIKLGAGVLGGCKTVISQATNYANERKQFNTPISSFGAIKHKLAEMAIQTWVTESACYRGGQNIDDKITDLIDRGTDPAEAKLKSFEQFSIECAIIKILGSEALDYVVDQGVQIYGGMGFSEEAPMARAYRDARITRIYEGTNEINRMLMVGMIMKRAMKGELNIMEPAMAVAKELVSVPSFEVPDLSKPFAKEKDVLVKLKKAVLMVAGKAAQTFGPKLEEEQEIMMNAADMMIQIYAAESALLRAEKLVSIQGEEASKMQINAAKVYLYEAVELINKAGKDAIASFATGDEQKVMLMGLKRFTKINPVNIKQLRREIADHLISKNQYAL
ncbi:acyl-CoA dehydrogenase family protein [Reichenbachiella carrageenanivorans]|uniref:Acyl-CoA dehydrogenase family protein n=1 Tax=Reichenbachiella carrageenanivorans TaxID=2979869 RepID=A0ABY6CZ18_9BACT|nr:acyl-CoA dehydrogenase family protein [Reichenbachiella carrageenanivorans]UXX79157.1 acyl-CoA dehydrogenase family protein [Reichenbachiella carrageenanivorans]